MKTLLILTAIISVAHVGSRPIGNDDNSLDPAPHGPVATIDFLRKYGYLESGSSNSSETIYTEEKIREGISLMQKFGGLEPTGILDNSTLQLLTKSRCGVADVVQSNDHKRTRRFAIASKGWNKRTLTYSFQNWSPKIGQESAIKDMTKAFNVWADYSNLRFKQKPANTDADILISFRRGYHGDSYPFDGKGHVLAHAYYPNDYEGLAGDVHFDEDEDWWSSSGQPTDKLEHPISFVDVAAHELGHSLGLSHSTDQESIMFPYYQGKLGKTPALGYDDILAMYQLYIQRDIPVGNESDNEEDDGMDRYTSSTSRPTVRPSMTTTTTRPRPTTQVSKVTTSPTITTTTERTTTRPSTAPPTRSTTSSSTSSENENSDSNEDKSVETDYEKSVKNICSNVPFKITFLRNEIFVFRGQYMWRLAVRGAPPPPAYPVTINHLFSPLSHLQRVDAAYERDLDGQLIFFSGSNYWELDGTTASPESPKPLTELGLPSTLKKLDAAFVWEKNGLTYFFSGHQYWRYNETTKKVDDGYPLSMERWGGVPTPVDSVLRWKDGKTYFFQGDDFWRFDDVAVFVEEHFPLKTKSYWFGC
ncbi:unnamed protein product [Allacma fusca]|uniref:Peptidase metallopeptidase domain-containing protein n=1 Tax=Allacma fusca TaxID=39272 RepID=A0A8J2JRU4_9HEXA|nr:unnamed protein product [Allacma fusca]